MINNNKIISFKFSSLEGVYYDDKNFCLECFLMFFFRKREEIEIFKQSKITYIIDKNNLSKYFPRINKGNIYLKNSKDNKVLTFTFHRHPYCKKHKSSFFINTKDLYDEYKSIDKVLNIDEYLIEKDIEINGINGIVKYLNYSKISTALSHNPMSYLSDNEELFYICSGYKHGRKKVISERVSLMEGIERFLEFSYCSNSLIGKNKLIYNSYNGVEYLDLNNHLYVFDNPNFTQSEYLVKVYNIQEDKEYYVDSNLIVVNEKSEFNIINSTGGSTHFDLEKAVLNGLEELLERDALMKMWLYRYTPHEYKHSLIPNDYKDIYDELCNQYTLHFYKIKTEIGYTTLSFGINKLNVSNNNIFIYGSAHSFKEEESLVLSLSEMYITYNNLDKYYFKELKKKEVENVMDHYYYYQNLDNYKDLSFIFNSNKIVSLFEKSEVLDFNSLIKTLPIDFYMFSLTPQFLLNKGIFTVKIVSPDLQPMDFGYYNLRLSNKIDRDKLCKQSLLNPHPFF